jgi:hypothetical protein
MQPSDKKISNDNAVAEEQLRGYRKPSTRSNNSMGP